MVDHLMPAALVVQLDRRPDEPENEARVQALHGMLLRAAVPSTLRHVARQPEPSMEWILVLVFTFGRESAVTHIPGHKSEAACLATLEKSKRAAEKSFSISPGAANDLLIRSFCVQRG
jgi:hypothetical protein